MLPKVTWKLSIFLQRSELFIASKMCLRVNAFFVWEGKNTEIHVLLGKGWLESREVSRARCLGWLQEVCFTQTFKVRKKQATLSSCGIGKCRSFSGSDERPRWGGLWGREGAFVGELAFCDSDPWGLKNNASVCTSRQLPESRKELCLTLDGILLIHCWPYCMVTK